jgi:hypothetical protein
MKREDPQLALRDDVDWVHQPAFIEEFWRLTDGEPLTGVEIHFVSEHHREPQWNFTGDDVSYTQ